MQIIILISLNFDTYYKFGVQFYFNLVFLNHPIKKKKSLPNIKTIILRFLKIIDAIKVNNIKFQNYLSYILPHLNCILPHVFLTQKYAVTINLWKHLLSKF